MPEEPLRSVAAVVNAVHTLEGAGFPVRRPFPTEQLPLVDPFLLLDHLGPIQWKPGEAVGAPDHPHRGFETISYVLAGKKEHKDSQGHQGNLEAGDVQWMTAGAGVIHSEMPESGFRKAGGLYHGFQIWVNLPARDKMMKPRYQDVRAAKIPRAQSPDGRVMVRVIAGQALGAKAVIDTRIPVHFLHYTLKPGGRTLQELPAEENALVYMISGALTLGSNRETVREGQMALLSSGGGVELEAPEATPEPAVPAEQAGPSGQAEPSLPSGVEKPGAEFLLLSGKPLNEPVARWGPFVMNTQEEILQAIEDYNAGRMGTIDF